MPESNYLTKKEQLFFSSLSPLSDDKEECSAPLFTDNTMNCTDAPCFFFYPKRREPDAFLSVFYGSPLEAEFTLWNRKRVDVSPLLDRALQLCDELMISSPYLTVKPDTGYTPPSLSGFSFTREYSEYFLFHTLSKLANSSLSEGCALSYKETDKVLFFTLLFHDRPVCSCKVAAFPEEKNWYLYDLLTEEEEREKGFATELIQNSAAILSSQKSGRLFLQVSSKNIAAVCLYRKLGFETKEQRDYYAVRRNE